MKPHSESARYIVVQVTLEGTWTPSAPMKREEAYLSVTGVFGVRCYICRIEAVMEPVMVSEKGIQQ